MQDADGTLDHLNVSTPSQEKCQGVAAQGTSSLETPLKKRALPPPSPGIGSSKVRRISTPQLKDAHEKLDSDRCAKIPISEAEAKRQCLYGGAPLRHALKALTGIVKEISPSKLQELHTAFSQDLYPEVDEVFSYPPRVVEGDRIWGDYKEYRCKVEIGHGDGSDFHARLLLLRSGRIAAVLDARLSIDSSAQSLRPSRVKLEITSSTESIGHGALPSSFIGDLSNRCLEGSGFKWSLVRSRALFSPDSQWCKFATQIQQALPACRKILKNVYMAPEIQEDVRKFIEWRKELLDISQRLDAAKSEFLVHFIGSSGAGKSKLINMLLGDAEILPSAGEGSAVTAAPVHLRYRRMGTNSKDCFEYSIMLELFTEKEFAEIRDKMVSDLFDYWELIASGAENDEDYECKSDVESQVTSRSVADEEVEEGEEEEEEEEEEDEEVEDSFRIPASRPPPDDDAKAARTSYDWLVAVFGTNAFVKSGWESAEHARAAFKKLPPKICGPPQKENRYREQAEVVKQLKLWLVQDDRKARTGQLWPLVKRANVYGPWQILAHGVVFVDLPGFGDANGSRNDVALREYQNVDFVCICSRMDRAATDKLALEWLQKALRDLGKERVAYICTKTDDINRKEMAHGHSASNVKSKAAAAISRNSAVRKKIQSAHAVCVHTVSSQDYGRCVGLEDERPETFFDAPPTEVEKLGLSILNTLLQQKTKPLMNLQREVHAKLVAMESQLAHRPSAVFNAATLRAKFETQLKSLKLILKGCVEKTAEAMTDKFDIKSIAKKGIESSRRGLSSKASYYGSDTTLHWRRHKAVIDYDGRWLEHDIPSDVSAPVIKEIDSQWIDAFDRITEVTGKMQISLVKAVEKFVDQYAKSTKNLHEYARSLGDAQIEGIKVMLATKLEVFDEFTKQKRMGYAEEVHETVTSELASTFTDAKAYSGKGSFALRKESVTNNLPRMRLGRSVDAPTMRWEAVMNKFAEVSSLLVNGIAEIMQQSFASLWEEQEKAELEAPLKLALRGVLEKNRDALEDILKSVQVAWPG